MKQKRWIVLVALVAAWVAFVIALVAHSDPEEPFRSQAAGACPRDVAETSLPIPAVPPRAAHLGLQDLTRRAEGGLVNLESLKQGVVVSGESLVQLVRRGQRINGGKVTWVAGRVTLFGTFPHKVRLDNLFFSGGLKADGATFAQGLRIRGSVLAASDPSENSALSMNHATVFEDLDLRENEFVGDVDLSRIHVNGSLYLDRGVFLAALSEDTLDTSNMNITGGFEVRYSCFFPAVLSQGEGGWRVTSHNSTVGGSAIFDGSEFHAFVDLSNMSVHRALSFAGAWVACAHEPCGADFGDLEVHGSANFDGSVFQGCMSWDRASFEALDLDIRAEKVGKTCDVWVSADLMSYKHVLSPRGIYGMTRFSRMLFSNEDTDLNAIESGFVSLEGIARNQGYIRLANYVYVEGQRTQQKHLQKMNRASLWSLSAFLQWLKVTQMGFVDSYIRYGRDPVRAIVICVLLIVAFGLFLRIMQEWPQAPQRLKPPQELNAFQYSVTTFLWNNWHQKERTPDLPRALRVVVIVYMLIGVSLFTVLVYYVSGNSWPAVIPILAGALVPLGGRIGELTRRGPRG